MAESKKGNKKLFNKNDVANLVGSPMDKQDKIEKKKQVSSQSNLGRKWVRKTKDSSDTKEKPSVDEVNKPSVDEVYSAGKVYKFSTDKRKKPFINMIKAELKEPSTGKVYKPSVDILKEFSTGKAYKPSVGRVKKPFVGKVKESSVNKTKRSFRSTFKDSFPRAKRGRALFEKFKNIFARKVKKSSFVKGPSTDKVKKPSIDTVKEPSIDTVKEPSIGKVRKPSVDKVKEPSSDKAKKPSSDKVKKPSRDKVKGPSSDKAKKSSSGKAKESFGDNAKESSRDKTKESFKEKGRKFSTDKVKEPLKDKVRKPSIGKVKKSSMGKSEKSSIPKIKKSSADKVKELAADRVKRSSLIKKVEVKNSKIKVKSLKKVPKKKKWYKRKKRRKISKIKPFDVTYKKQHRSIFRYNPGYYFKRKAINLLATKKVKRVRRKLKYIMNIKITPNNVFCVLRDRSKTLLVQSSGILRIKVSQKKLKHVFRLLIAKFFYKAFKRMKERHKKLWINLVGPKKTRKPTLKSLISKLRGKKDYLINIQDKKVFNGCQAKKKRRKKGKRMRVFGS